MSAARRDAAHWVMIETDNIQLRTNVRRDHAVQIARDMQRTYDVLARFALPCAAKRAQDRVPVTVLPFREFSPLAPNALGFYRARRYDVIRSSWTQHEGGIEEESFVMERMLDGSPA